MRPSVDVPDAEHYECTACGERVTDPDRERCGCGGDLRNINRSRDL